MIIQPKDQKKLNSIFLFLRNQPPEYFETNGISKCETCNGTGLSTSKMAEMNSASWNTHDFCDRCEGIGYIGLAGKDQIDDIYWVCRRCNGEGCSICNKIGVTDWVSNIMGGKF